MTWHISGAGNFFLGPELMGNIDCMVPKMRIPSSNDPGSNGVADFEHRRFREGGNANQILVEFRPRRARS